MDDSSLSLSTFHVSRFTFHVPAIIALLCVAAIYVGALWSLPPDAFTYHDEGAKYLQVRNLRLTPAGIDWSINYPARRLDPQLHFVPFHPKQHYTDGSGRIYLQWPIFLGLLTRIPWKVMQFQGLYLLPLMAGLATLWASYLLALQIGVPKRAAWLAIPLVGLATPLAQYSLLYFEHTLATMLVALSMLAALEGMVQSPKSKVQSPKPSLTQNSKLKTQNSLWSGALLALAVYFRSELYVLALVTMLVYLVLGWRRRTWRLPVAWGLGFALMLVPLWAFYAVNEGTLLPTHALWYFVGGESASPGGIPKPGLPPLRYIASAGWGAIPAFLFGPQTAPFAPTPPGWVEVAGLAGAGMCALAALGRLVRRPSMLVARLVTLTLGLALLLASTAAVLLSPQPYHNLHGFLLAAPFVVLALWPTDDDSPKSKVQSPKSERSNVQTFKRSTLYTISLLYVGLHALIISALSGLGPISLHEWGQRYLLPAYPLLAVLALFTACRLWSGAETHKQIQDRSTVTRHSSFVIRHSSRITLLALWAALAVAGLGFTARGYWVLSIERAQTAEWQTLIRTLPDGEPMVTNVWWLPLNLAADFYTRPMMLAEGEDKLAQWTKEMQAKGLTSFGFAATDPAVYKALESRTPAIQADGPPRQARGVWLQRYKIVSSE